MLKKIQIHSSSLETLLHNNDAIRLDNENSNTHWQDAMDLVLTQIHEYKVSRTQVKHNSTMEK